MLTTVRRELTAVFRARATEARTIATAYDTVGTLLDAGDGGARQRELLDACAERWPGLLGSIDARDVPFPPTSNPDTFALYAADYRRLAMWFDDTVAILDRSTISPHEWATVRYTATALTLDEWRRLGRAVGRDAARVLFDTTPTTHD